MTQLSRILICDKFGVYYLKIEQLKVPKKTVCKFVPIVLTTSKNIFICFAEATKIIEKSENCEKVSSI